MNIIYTKFPSPTKLSPAILWFFTSAQGLLTSFLTLFWANNAHTKHDTLASCHCKLKVSVATWDEKWGVVVLGMKSLKEHVAVGEIDSSTTGARATELLDKVSKLHSTHLRAGSYRWWRDLVCYRLGSGSAISSLFHHSSWSGWDWEQCQ